MQFSFGLVFHSIRNRCRCTYVRIYDYSTLKVPLRDVDGVNRDIHYLDIDSTQNNSLSPPPLVILCGTAQTISTFGPQIRPISRSRRLIIPELRCQGQTDLLSQYGTIEQHVDDFYSLMKVLNIKKIHLAGFSFGGRVGLAIAMKYPELVEKLSVTGVPLHRPPLGKAILDSWKDGLQHGQLLSCAWSFILNGYSPAFIEKYEAKLPSFVDMILKSNDPLKLYHLLTYSHVYDDNFSVPFCASKIICPVQVIGSTEDRIASLASVQALGDAINGSSLSIVEGGHLVPFESPQLWRKLMLDFFSD